MAANPAAPAENLLLQQSCALPGDTALSLAQARASSGWICGPSGEDVSRPYVWLRIDGANFPRGEDLLLRTDSLGFRQITTVTELRDGRLIVRRYDPDDLGRYWTLATRFAVPIVRADQQAARLWVRIDEPLDRNTATLVSVETVAEDASQRLSGMVLFALFCGMQLVAAIYSLALAIALRSRFALWHGLSAALFLTYTVSASSLLFMMVPDLSLWHRSAISYLTLALSIAVLPPFLTSFLEQGALPRWLVRLMLIAGGVIAAGGIGFVLLAQALPFVTRPIYHLSFLPLIIVAIVAAVVAWRRGSKAVRMTTLAWAPPALVAVDRILRGLNLYIAPTEWDFAFYGAMAWQSVFMAMALNWRIGIIRRERDLAMAQEQVQGKLAQTDVLTGLPNRRAFDQRTWRKGDYLAILDADHFKHVNDRYGHQTGDRVLVALGGELTRCTVEAGACLSAFRLGGEEFAVVVTARSAEMAALQVNVLRHRLSSAIATVMPEIAEPVTVSAGLAVIGESGLEDAYRAADTALYKAKHAGRDRLCYELDQTGTALIFPRPKAA